MDPAERFAALVDTFAADVRVTGPAGAARRGFGSSTLKVKGSIFAMLAGGRLVVKLPRDRVDALIGNGLGAPYDAGRGRPMKEWLTVTGDDDETWLTLAREAMDFGLSRCAGR